MILPNLTSHQWGQMLVVAVWKHASTVFATWIDTTCAYIDSDSVSHNQPFSHGLKQQGFTSVALIISEAMFILETFQVEHTRISEEKLQLVFLYHRHIHLMIHHQYIYHIYDIYEESEWKSSQDLSAKELSGEDVGGRVSWVPTAAHANSAVLVATSPSRDRTDVFRVHWSIKMFSENFADDSPGGFSSKWCRKMANITGDLETNIRCLCLYFWV